MLGLGLEGAAGVTPTHRQFLVLAAKNLKPFAEEPPYWTSSFWGLCGYLRESSRLSLKVFLGFVCAVKLTGPCGWELQRLLGRVNRHLLPRRILQHHYVVLIVHAEWCIASVGRCQRYTRGGCELYPFGQQDPMGGMTMLGVIPVDYGHIC